MQTIGFWCDECRRKYVRHACRDSLPCGHSKAAAVLVYAKAYGRGGETVELNWTDGGGEHYRELWISLKQGDRTWKSGGSMELWGYRVDVMHHLDKGEKLNIDVRGLKPCVMAHWLKEHPEHVIRAFMARWESFNEPPPWRMLAIIPEESFEQLLQHHSGSFE
jgi:hypothetical protein